jgi:hypothetical protein
VQPDCQRAGIGSALLEVAKSRRPGGLRLWVFQRNHGAWAVYARHGFTEVRFTDGSDNEEQEPDVFLADLRNGLDEQRQRPEHRTNAKEAARSCARLPPPGSECMDRGMCERRLLRGNALFHGRMPNEAAQLLPRRLIRVGCAGRTLRRVLPCPLDQRVSLPDSQATEGRRADGDGG